MHQVSVGCLSLAAWLGLANVAAAATAERLPGGKLRDGTPIEMVVLRNDAGERPLATIAATCDNG